MNVHDYFSLPEKEFPGAVILAPFYDQYQVWRHLRYEIIDRNNHNLFTSHFLPLLTSIIRPYLNKVRITDREDFMQDLALAFFRRLPDYNPDYNGQRLLGNIFFQYVVRGEYKKYLQKVKSCAEPAHKSNQAPSFAAPSAEDVAIAKIEGQYLMEKYHKMQGKYKSKYTAIYKTMKGEDL